jgi:hypothetical protein
MILMSFSYFLDQVLPYFNNKTFPVSEVNYVSMFPRHVTVCCSDHMTEEDVWMMDGIRREVDREVKDLLTDGDDFVTVLD